MDDEGTFNSVINRLDYLQELGINMIELLPIAAFQGDGYVVRSCTFFSDFIIPYIMLITFEN